jgi:hypothetical protein
MTRMVILHYHLFKNAGTSLDRILKQNFGDAWVTREFEAKARNTTDVEDWIASQPDAIAFSSHTMNGPLPRVGGVEIIPVIFLREPIDRIQSAYKFERKQQADTLGAKLAKEHDFEGYVRARLAIPGDQQCRNFHASILAKFAPRHGSLLERAMTGLWELQDHGIVGAVEDFEAAIQALADRIKTHYPNFKWDSTRVNVSSGEVEMPRELREILEKESADDRALWKVVREVY